MYKYSYRISVYTGTSQAHRSAFHEQGARKSGRRDKPVHQCRILSRVGKTWKDQLSSGVLRDR